MEHSGDRVEQPLTAALPAFSWVASLSKSLLVRIWMAGARFAAVCAQAVRTGWLPEEQRKPSEARLGGDKGSGPASGGFPAANEVVIRFGTVHHLSRSHRAVGGGVIC